MWAIRVGLSQWLQTSMTLPIDIGWARSRIPPCWTFGVRSFVLALWRGFVWRFAMLRPSTTTAVVASGDIPSQTAAVLRLGLLEALRVADDALDRAALAGVLAGQDDDGVARADLGDLRDARRGVAGGHHSTSGASETIFM